MKIKRGDFYSKITNCYDLYTVIERVVIPFTPQIKSRKISVYISSYEICKIKADWSKYQLIIFNLLQNSIKYNRSFGKIIINLNIIGSSLDKDRILETKIIDSGTGIRDDKQSKLFIPF